MKLKEFYKQTVFKNDFKLGGWSVFYYGIFSKIINDNGYKNVVEVGVGYGTHAKHILKSTLSNPELNLDSGHGPNRSVGSTASNLNLYLIDPLIYYPNDDFAKDIMSHEPEIPDNNFNELYDLINKELEPFKDRYKWFRKKSLEITDTDIPDASLDAVFIDGAHDYDNVYKDLMFWYNKVRPGGQILGDDFWMNDVARAVNDFSKMKNLKYDLLTLPNNNYQIYRFFKN